MHVVRTGRNYMWIYILLFLPGLWGLLLPGAPASQTIRLIALFATLSSPASGVTEN